MSAKKKTAKFYDSPLNKRIRELMNEGKIRTDDLAKALSVTVEAVRLWCAGYARPDIDKLPVISRFFDVSTDYLLGLSDIRNKEEFADAVKTVNKFEKLMISLPERDYKNFVVIFTKLINGFNNLGKMRYIYLAALEHIGESMGDNPEAPANSLSGDAGIIFTNGIPIEEKAELKRMVSKRFAKYTKNITSAIYGFSERLEEEIDRVLDIPDMTGEEKALFMRGNPITPGRGLPDNRKLDT